MTVVATHDQVPQVSRPISAVAHRPVPVGGAAPGTGLTGKDIVRMLRRRMWLIIITFVTVVSIVTAFTLVWLFYSPFYTAEAILKVAPPQAGPLSIQAPNMTPREVMDRLTATQARLLHSEGVFLEALKKPDITGTAWYAKDKTKAIDRLLDDVSISAMPGTELIRVSMTGTNANELMKIVNAVADSALKHSRESASLSVAAQTSTLQDKRNDIDKQLTSVRKQMVDLRPKDIPGMEATQAVLNARLQALVGQMTPLQKEKGMLEDALEQIQKSADLTNAPEVRMAIDMDPTLRGLEQYRVSLQTEQETIRRTYGPKSRQYLDMQTRLKTVETQIAETRQSVIERASSGVRAARQDALNGVNRAIASLQDSMEELTIKQRDQDTIIRQTKELVDQETSVKLQLTQIDNKILELQIIAQGQAPIYLVAKAPTPREPSMPKLTIFIGLGGVLGLVAAFGLAFLLEFMDTSVKTPTDISRKIDMPVLGMIPHGDDLDEDVEDVRLAWMTNPNSLIAEAFRQIRTNLLFSGPANQRRSLLITSPMPEDGRTTVTANLAAAMARGGRNVLVVDANFRQPTLGKLFPQVKDGGLSNALVGQAQWRDMVCEVEPNLSVMASGPLPPNPAELLGSEQMRHLIGELTGEYDQVIFDGAPSLVVSDSVILSTLVDGVVVVVRAGNSTHGVVNRSRDVLQRVGAHVLGAILNGVRATAGGYLRKSYETFYDYHEQAQLPSK